MVQDRWIDVSDSQFPHEVEGLNYLKGKIPNQSPYRVWSNFEFRDGRGGWHEVDALLLGRGQLHLLELKYYSGRLTGSDTQWLRDGKRAEASPLLLARRKAQYLASKLKDALRDWTHEKGLAVDERSIIPFVNQAVFLHHPNFTSDLPASAAIGLYGLDEAETTSHLPGISELIDEEPRAGRAIGQNQEAILVQLMARIGLVQRREREAGSWVIEDGAIDEGEGWQDWRGYHKVAKQEAVRIRFQTTAPGTAQSTVRRDYNIAEHEFRLMGRLSHDGLLSPRDLIDSELGVGLVYDYPDGMQRLDLWLAEQSNGVPLDQRLSIIRQLAEALDYAHRNQVAHRGLGPKAVWVKILHGQPKVQIGDWQSAGLSTSLNLTGLSGGGVTALLDVQSDPKQADAWLIDAFAAPEGRWLAGTADRVSVDIFALGALAYYILSSEPPATSASALRERLRNQHGLDLSIDLPAVSPSIRNAVLKATKPAPSERFEDVGQFIDGLLAIDDGGPAIAEDLDPVDAGPGTVLVDGRFAVVRRLGRGSTAVGLLVNDMLDGGTQRVLKVALDNKASHRLQDEAAVLQTVTGSRLVKMVEGPISVGERSALVLESAGDETLSQLLRERKRLSLDLLERLGVDLLEALVQLDKAGVDHRDIKPGNLGVRAERSGKHLVLFDFSLSRAAASDLTAGTPPYVDPFLGGARSRFDSAAERYSAAVVLFEMAAGHTPYYGDPLADPSAVNDPLTIVPGAFDRAVEQRLKAFFTKALARNAKDRYDTAAEMLSQWRVAFPSDATTAPENADELADKAKPDTALELSGLSARALSGLEPLQVTTVGELMTVDPVRLNNIRGVAHTTKRELSTRAMAWRAKFANAESEPASGVAHLPSALALSEELVEASGGRKAIQSRAIAGLILGTFGDVDAFATQAQLGANLPNHVTATGANQLVGKLQTTWASDEQVLGYLTHLLTVVNKRLDTLGGVATIDELAESVLAETAVASQRTERNQRMARGLLRIVVDRQRALKRADSGGDPLELRRRDGNAILIARRTELLDMAERLGREADALVGAATSQPALVPAVRVESRLAAIVRVSGIDDDPMLLERSRLSSLAAGTSNKAAASGASELHTRNLTQVEALGLCLRGVVGPHRLTAREIVDRVSVRFPTVAALPTSGRLQDLLHEAKVDLVRDSETGTFGAPTVLESGALTSSRFATATHFGGGRITGTTADSRLQESVAQRSFMALGVKADRSDALAKRLETDFNAHLIDVTTLLLDELQELAKHDGFPSWGALVRADAQTGNDRAKLGVAAAIQRALPVVESEIASAVDYDNGDASRPVVIVEASPLARYGHMDLIKKWSDLATRRRQAVWVLIPQLATNQGPLVDGVSIQTSPNQYLRIDTAWVDQNIEFEPSAVEGAPA